MKRELRDDHLYRQWYGAEKPSPQVGHFLTAVAWGRWHEQYPRLAGTNIDMVFIVGHELTIDRWGSEDEAVATLLGLAVQIPAGLLSPCRRGKFMAAAYHYENVAERERLLAEVGAPSAFSRYPIGSRQRAGNSLEDLRLSALGWNLGRKIGNGELTEPGQVADWIETKVKR